MQKRNNTIIQHISTLLLVIATFSCSPQKNYDIIIKNGQIVDGSGNKSYEGDIGINADTIAAIGDLKKAKATKVIDASGLVVAPGFINMLSWAGETLILDGNAESDIKQGVTVRRRLEYGPIE